MEKSSRLKNKIKEDLKLTLFFGNGIGQAIPGEGISWGKLLFNLQSSLDANHIDLTSMVKPFPLSFEEIIYSATGNFDKNMIEIKEKIAQVFQSAFPNALHKRIMLNPNISDIITTNYDYAFEKVLIDDFNNSNERLPNSTTETKHSIRRRCVLNDYNDTQKSIWHIHGEINHNQNFRNDQYASESIQIGYDHYGEYLNQIQAYVKGSKFKKQPKMEVKLEENIEGVSWIDKLFTDKVIILGFGLDFSEIDLWWLFNYRMKVFKRNPNLPINEIIYYQPEMRNNPRDTAIDLRGFDSNDLESFELDIYKRRIKLDKGKAKEDVLTSIGIQFKPILCETYKEYYDNVFELENI